MHFTYADPPDLSELCQGDILARTPEIDSLLELVHPHFHKKNSNLYFMVLTQSCDLVPREGGRVKADYITISPVRSLDAVVGRQISSMQSPDVKAELPVLTMKAKNSLGEFLKRIYNNNESGYFYLDGAGTPLIGDCCAFLNLSIAIKAPEHYPKCLDAKILQLNDTFQAKLGWLVGQMYSRVGTRDWELPDLRVKVQATLENAAIWVPDASLKQLEDTYKTRAAEVETGSKTMTQEEIASALKKVPTKKAQILEQLTTVFSSAIGQLKPEENPEIFQALSRKIFKRLDGDAAFTRLTK